MSLITSLKALSPHTIILDVRGSVEESWEDTVQSIARYKRDLGLNPLKFANCIIKFFLSFIGM